MTFEKYKKAKQWHWRLRADNGEIVASGEAYKNQADCDAAIKLVKDTSDETPVKVL